MTIRIGTKSFTRGLVGTAGIVAAVTVATVMLATTPRSAQAYPAYADRTQTHCSVCHVNPKGGGNKLTKTGTKWFTGGMKTKVKMYK